MYLKAHSRQGQTIIAVADADLLGKKFKDEKRVLDLEQFADFYKGERVSDAEAEKLLKTAHSVNLVGKRAVALALKLKLAKKEDVVEIQGVPHLQIYRI